MIPTDAPLFILLVLAGAMVALLVALLNYISSMHLLALPVRIPFPFIRMHISCFIYLLLPMFGYLGAQLLTLIKIIMQIKATDSGLDIAIMSIFLGQNAYIINFLLWACRYRVELTANPVE